jgi:hypothetical protein
MGEAVVSIGCKAEIPSCVLAADVKISRDTRRLRELAVQC